MVKTFKTWQEIPAEFRLFFEAAARHIEEMKPKVFHNLKDSEGFIPLLEEKDCQISGAYSFPSFRSAERFVLDADGWRISYE